MNEKPRRTQFNHDFAPIEEYMTARFDDDSMKNDGIFKDSIIVLHKQRTAVNGDIVAVASGRKIYLRKYKQFGKTVMLMPANPAYEPMPYTDESDVVILGKVVQVTTFLD